MKKLNRIGDVIQYEKIGDGYWVVITTQMSGGETCGGMNRNEIYPDGYELVLRKIVCPIKFNLKSPSGIILFKNKSYIDWKSREKRFYQSGCFNNLLPYIEPIYNLAK